MLHALGTNVTVTHCSSTKDYTGESDTPGPLRYSVANYIFFIKIDFDKIVVP